jgi:hypothetical protein
MTDLPRCAMELVFTIEGGVVYRPVEAPPCGARLDIDTRGVHLACDRIVGHQDEEREDWSKHRAVIDAELGYALLWCEDDCAHRCQSWLANEVTTLKRAIEGGCGDG